MRTLHDHPAYGQFLMAHECCHHSLGHVAKFKQGLGQFGPQPFFYIAPALKQMSLTLTVALSDCFVSHEEDGIVAARTVMSMFGKEQTGAYYPTGDERVENIETCAGPSE
ncbi:MAG: hypothetical protein R3D01_09385 [Hyphomicrobiales bacterium]